MYTYMQRYPALFPIQPPPTHLPPTKTTPTDYSEELFVTEDDDVTVFLPSATKGGVEQYDGTLVVITTPDLEIYFTLETEGVLHLDVQVKLRSQDLTMPDGVLGQTVLWQLPEADKQLASGTEGFEVWLWGGMCDVECVMFWGALYHSCRDPHVCHDNHESITTMGDHVSTTPLIDHPLSHTLQVKHGLPGIQCPTCVFVPRLTSDQVAQMRRRLMSAKL